jgi:hypothetical protein
MREGDRVLVVGYAPDERYIGHYGTVTDADGMYIRVVLDNSIKQGEVLFLHFELEVISSAEPPGSFQDLFL